ncbi:DUF4097 family beta strand repeat protein [Fulvivirga sp. 29W222]|uniref:DUF4097 family beta strand repeat protein n=1 Tax=Fulvivirga marina TaxID=2494733 RepID=A0A937FY85_9BACT|nr:DUF4097 family beta strand repeat-containing protein [Fulvivirga marina]MBL6448344.1 DUF4097 family beta strand repeat protein [Fulvivirga marina]
MYKFLLTLICLFPFFINAQDDVYNLDKTYEIASNGLIRLTSSDAKVYITSTNRTNARVKVYRNLKGSLSLGLSSFAMDIKTGNGSLIITEKYSGSRINLMGSSGEEYKIEIEAPKNVRLDIHGDGDKYKISNIDGSIEMYLDDADADLKNCNGKDFRFTFYDSDIRLDKGAGSLFVKANDGDLQISEGKFDKVNATIEDGDLVMTNALANSGEYFYDIDDGNLILNFTEGGANIDITHEDTQINASEDFTPIQKNENRTRLAFKTSNASVKIRAEDSMVSMTSTK